MWHMRKASPTVTGHVVFISDEAGNQYSFPVERGNITLSVLRLTFPLAVGIFYVDGRTDGLPVQPVRVHIRDGVFNEPQGGWIKQFRKYFVIKKKQPNFEMVGREMLKKYQALTQGVTLYFERPDPKKKKVVAAIDFGTSFSGYAYIFEHEPFTVYTHSWTADSIATGTEKAPTTVLVDPSGKFHSFGYEAEDEYALLVDGEMFHDWYFFRNFKMKLYTNKYLRRDSVLRDIEGKQMPALEVFAMAIRHLYKCLVDDVKTRDPDVKRDDITWVITVPAIWSDAAKQFMREASVKAGIDNDKLKLVLEPEAASLYCKALPPDDIQAIAGMKTDHPLARGKQYILLDLGGGTADMSAHHVLKDGCLREIHRATGDALGGSSVDEAFSKLLSDVIGPETLLAFFHDYRQDYVVFMRDFEKKKRLPLDRNSKVVLKLPPSLSQVLKVSSDATIEEAVQKSAHAKHIRVNGENMQLDGDLMADLFKDTVNGIIRYIREMRAHSRLTDVDTIVLAGGFSESLHVREAIQDNFPKALIVSPADPGIAILKGAVLMGFRPEVIKERVARYTYGISYARRPFCEGDPEELLAHRNGETYCDGIFEKLVTIGQPIQRTDVFTLRRTTHLTSRRAKQRRLYTRLFASIEENPEYCTEECFCVKIGEIVRHPPKGGWPDVVKSRIEIKFGETEMSVRIFEEHSKIEYRARVDFL
ncbi:heat shock 70 kDa protein 12A-like isoform X1 [Mya arenaria]|uniref:heat shock 70 kDa protein 12A-like isoform X1 n=1 Tax=Mya arenaria TaxID=6604 RepID=UPI0022E19554|nr:heat shock 70 kDa protein 12A-like isoform X1 [Mya arenaria]